MDMTQKEMLTRILRNTEVIIDDARYIVQDRGRVINGNRINVYFESHQDALEFGVQYKEAFTERMIEND